MKEFCQLKGNFNLVHYNHEIVFLKLESDYLELTYSKTNMLSLLGSYGLAALLMYSEDMEETS